MKSLSELHKWPKLKFASERERYEHVIRKLSLRLQKAQTLSYRLKSKLKDTLRKVDSCQTSKAVRVEVYLARKHLKPALAPRDRERLDEIDKKLGFL